VKKLNKNYIIEAILVAVAVVAIYSIVQVNVPLTSAAVSGVDIGSSVCIYLNNQPIGPCTHNAMMTGGLNWVKTLIGNWSGGGSPVKFIALGNTSTAESPADTTLAGQINDCGLAIAESAYASVGNGNWSMTKQFTVAACPGGNIVVNTTALYNQTGASCTGACMMFAGKNFSNPVTLMNGDQLNITWYIWVT